MNEADDEEWKKLERRPEKTLPLFHHPGQNNRWPKVRWRKLRRERRRRTGLDPIGRGGEDERRERKEADEERGRERVSENWRYFQDGLGSRTPPSVRLTLSKSGLEKKVSSWKLDGGRRLNRKSWDWRWKALTARTKSLDQLREKKIKAVMNKNNACKLNAYSSSYIHRGTSCKTAYFPYVSATQYREEIDH